MRLLYSPRCPLPLILGVITEAMGLTRRRLKFGSIPRSLSWQPSANRAERREIHGYSVTPHAINRDHKRTIETKLPEDPLIHARTDLQNTYRPAALSNLQLLPSRMPPKKRMSMTASATAVTLRAKRSLSCSKL